MTLVVAGGSRGIGLELARALVPQDRRVLIGYSSDSEAARAAAEDLEKNDAQVSLVRVDLNEPDGADDLIAAVGGEPIDHLIHSCVTIGPGSLLEPGQGWASAWGRALSVNAMSLAWLSRAAVPWMRPGSTILYVTSRGSSRVYPGYASVGPAKAFAESIVRHLAVLAPRDIRVNALAPAAQDTASFRAAFGDDSPP